MGGLLQTLILRKPPQDDDDVTLFAQNFYLS